MTIVYMSGVIERVKKDVVYMYVFIYPINFLFIVVVTLQVAILNLYGLKSNMIRENLFYLMLYIDHLTQNKYGSIFINYTLLKLILQTVYIFW